MSMYPVPIKVAVSIGAPRAPFKLACVCLVFFCIFTRHELSLAMDHFLIKEGKTVYGKVLEVKVKEGETLLDIARQYDLGYNQIIAANPSIDPWTPPKGAKILVPKIFVLPSFRPPTGILVNLAEMRLYFFGEQTSSGQHLYTSPVGVGREGFTTALGVYTVLSKAKNPVWVVPPSVKKEEPDLPDRVPPGPENPLGGYIIRFSRLQYGIHGTNRPWGVGRRVSHGCIRLYPEDIAQLFPLVPVGALIQIDFQPIKAGWDVDTGQCWLQVFYDYEGKVKDPLAEALLAVDLCEQALGPLDIDLMAIKEAVKQMSGVPRVIAHVAQD